MVESELTSSTAATIAGPRDLPMAELEVNKAPIFTTLKFPILAITTPTHKQEIKNTKTTLDTYARTFIF